jgi:hypothetical protein
MVSVTPRPRFTPGERTPGTHWTGGWVGPRTGLDTEDRGKIPCPCRGSNPDLPVVQPVVRTELHGTVLSSLFSDVEELCVGFLSRSEIEDQSFSISLWMHVTPGTVILGSLRPNCLRHSPVQPRFTHDLYKKKQALPPEQCSHTHTVSSVNTMSAQQRCVCQF